MENSIEIDSVKLLICSTKCWSIPNQTQLLLKLNHDKIIERERERENLVDRIIQFTFVESQSIHSRSIHSEMCKRSIRKGIYLACVSMHDIRSALRIPTKMRQQFSINISASAYNFFLYVKGKKRTISV